MPSPRWLGLRHLALRVRDVEVSRRFYCDLFGMAVEWAPDADNLYLTSGQDNLALHRADDVETGPRSALDHLGFCVKNAEDVDVWQCRAEEFGAEIVQASKTHRDGARSFYLRDPDGHLIQILHHLPLADLPGAPDPFEVDTPTAE